MNEMEAMANNFNQPKFITKTKDVENGSLMKLLSSVKYE